MPFSIEIRSAALVFRSARMVSLAALFAMVLCAHGTCPAFAQELTMDHPARAGMATRVELSSAHEALGVCLSKEAASLFGVGLKEASLPEVTGAPITLASAQPGIPTLAQASAPVIRGCGMLTYTPAQRSLPTGGGENPLFTRSRELLADPAFGGLTEPVRQKFLGEWDGLHLWQTRLLKEAPEILADWKKVEAALDPLDTLGCKVKAEVDELEPAITKWNDTCTKGDPATADWCATERARLEPLVAHRDASLKDFDAKLKEYNDTLAVPATKRSDEWAASFLNWIDKVKDFNQRLEGILTNAPKPPGWTQEWKPVDFGDGRIRWKDPSGNIWTWHPDADDIHGRGGNHWDVGTQDGRQFVVDPVTGEWRRKR